MSEKKKKKELDKLGPPEISGKVNGFDISKIMKPINPTTIIVVLLAGLLPTGAAKIIGDATRPSEAVNCSTEIGRAIDEHKANPNVVVRYTGPVEDQCKINDILDKINGR